MRLLNVYTLQFEEFIQEDAPPYGILSHTWTNEEVSYDDFLRIRATEASPQKRVSRNLSRTTGWPSGYTKIVNFCSLVRARRIFNFDRIRRDRPEAFERSDRYLRGQWETLQWVWIDTCCIDKTSSAEVFEAINSMWQHYWCAEECYVYLSDVPDKPFERSRWFTRGWTLPELLAPGHKIFFSSRWETIGQISSGRPTAHTRVPGDSSRDLIGHVSNITGIPPAYLNGVRPVRHASIAQRLSWAANRNTTKVEDRYYCLMGLFGVNMPVIYGEGRRAFLRLQEEILRNGDDMSILFWQYTRDNLAPGLEQPVGVLAPHVGCFANSFDIERIPYVPGYHFSEKNTRLKLWARSRRVLAAADNGCVLHLIHPGHPNKGPNGIDPGQYKYEIALIECRHQGPSEFYRSRCNEQVAAADFCLSFPATGRPQNGVEPQKIYVRKVCTAEEQCPQCSNFDRQLAGAMQQRRR